METNPASGAPPVNNPQVGSPINPVVPTVQAPAAQASTPAAPTTTPQQPSPQATSNPPVTQPQSPVSAVTSEKKSSKFKLFLIISVVFIVLIWGTVAYLYFQNQSL
jgi:uncharacterized protein HemX